MKTSFGSSVLLFRHFSPAIGKSLKKRTRVSRFDIEPLVSEVGTRANRQQWLVARGGKASQNPWSAAHDILPVLQAAYGTRDIYVEPELLYEWRYKNREDVQELDAPSVCAVKPQKDKFWGKKALFPHFGAFLERGYTQLLDARNAAAASAPVCVAHLDTGFDKGHMAKPENFGQERNFIDAGSPYDASDPGLTGILRQPGHGTGTLGILAGAASPIPIPCMTGSTIIWEAHPFQKSFRCELGIQSFIFLQRQCTRAFSGPSSRAREKRLAPHYR